jgi:hypothetical protein
MAFYEHQPLQANIHAVYGMMAVGCASQALSC